jgi:hypothetical protein
MALLPTRTWQQLPLLLSIFAFCASLPTLRAADEDSPEATPTSKAEQTESLSIGKSRAALQTKLASMEQEISAGRQGTRVTSDFLEKVADALSKVKDDDAEKADRLRQCGDAASAFERASTMPDNYRPALESLRKSVTGGLGERSVSDLSFHHELDPLMPYLYAGSGPRVEPLPAHVSKIFQTEIAKAKSPDWKPKLPGLAKLMDWMENKDSGNERPPESLIAEAKPDIQNMSGVVEWICKSETDAVRASLVAIRDRVTAESEQMKDEIVRKEKAAEVLDQSLNAAEKAQLQTSVADNLHSIFWGIVAAIIAVLVILRWKADEQSMLMIRERTAVEMLSIGMFLVTVLFLGAGGFIEKSTLGTLLGTLAGYLFTRRSGTPAAEATQAEGAARNLPVQPGKPAYAPATKTISLPAMPKNAKFITAFCHPSTGGPETILGSSTTKEIICDTSKLTPGSYKAWVVASGAGGTSQPSAEFDLDIP